MENDKIEERLDELRDIIWQIKLNQETYIAAQKEMCLAHTAKTDILTQKVLGNGKPGLVSDVQNIQKEMSILKYILASIILPIAGFFGVKLF